MNSDQTLDCKGLSCPMPIMKVSKAIKSMESGKVLEMMSTDPGTKSDLPKWCDKTGNTYLGDEDGDGFTTFYIRKA